MTRLLEDQSLRILESQGLLTPRWHVIRTPDEAFSVARDWGMPIVLKALVPIGGRLKGGMVRFASTPREANSIACEMLGGRFKGFPVSRLLASEMLKIEREFFLAITFDGGGSHSPVFLFSTEGGVDVEESLRGRPDSLVRHRIDITADLTDDEAQTIVSAIGIDNELHERVAEALRIAHRSFRATDAMLLEINPLVLASDGRLVAASALVTVDDRAAFRQPWLQSLDEIPNNGWRPLTPLEIQMREIDTSDPTVGPIRFNEFLEGDIAMMVTGGGAGLTALDAMQRAGGRAATTFDIKIGQIEDKMYHATLAVLSRPGLKGMIIGANFSSFMGIGIKVRGVVRALKDAGWDPRRLPIVMRFCGSDQEEAARLAASVPGLIFLDETSTLEDAVELIVQIAGD